MSGLRLFGFTRLGRADVRRLAGAQISVGGINTVAGLLMNRGGGGFGGELVSSLLPPAKSGALPINIAAQNDSGGDVFNGFVTGYCISDSIQVINGSRFDLNDQIELATDRGDSSYL